MFENSDVIGLDLQTIFKFYRRKEIWTILFHKSNEKSSRDLVTEYKMLAEKMFGIIKVGSIDCFAEEELCEEFGVFDSPQVKIYTEKESDDGIKFTGKLQWKSISAAASKKMQSFVRVVSKDNYDAWIQEQPEKHKVLLFTDRKSTAPLFKSLSKTFKDKLMFGEVKKDEELQSKFGVQKVPTLLVVTNVNEHKGEEYNMENIKID